MRALRILNAVLALVAELALLAAAIAAPLASGLPGPLRIVGAVLLPVALVAVWAGLMAPRAPRRLAPAPRLVASAVLFGLGVLGLAVDGLVALAVALAVLAAARLVLGARLGEV